jgi:hypothetical protein
MQLVFASLVSAIFRKEAPTRKNKFDFVRSSAGARRSFKATAARSLRCRPFTAVRALARLDTRFLALRAAARDKE